MDFKHKNTTICLLNSFDNCIVLVSSMVEHFYWRYFSMSFDSASFLLIHYYDIINHKTYRFKSSISIINRRCDWIAFKSLCHCFFRLQTPKGKSK